MALTAQNLAALRRLTERQEQRIKAEAEDDGGAPTMTLARLKRASRLRPRAAWPPVHPCNAAPPRYRAALCIVRLTACSRVREE